MHYRSILFNSNTALQSGGIQIERFHAMVEVRSGARASTVQNTDQGDSRMKKMINNENISFFTVKDVCPTRGGGKGEMKYSDTSFS